MTATVFHLLTETDSFSDTHGAALQRWVANVLKFEARRSVVVCARSDKSWGLPHVEAFHLPGLWAYSKLKGRYRLPWSIRRPLLRKVLRPFIGLLKPGDVVWIHNRPDFAGAVESEVRAAGAKLVVHLHNSLLLSFPKEIARSFTADQVIFCSSYLKREAERAFPDTDNATVIHNGADELRFFPRHGLDLRKEEGADPVVLFAGRLVPEKGAHIFVEAMWLLQARGVRAVGRVLGATGFGSNNPATAYSKSLKMNAPGNVQFAGYRSAEALAEEFRSAEIFCSPSVWEEPFGLVNVEAMASGLPTVSTNGGGVPEIFAEGGAILVLRDSATELAAALETLIRDSDLRRRLAAEAYRSFQRNFTWKATHKRYGELVDRLGQSEVMRQTIRSELLIKACGTAQLVGSCRGDHETEVG